MNMIKTDVIDQIAYELYQGRKKKKSVNKFVERFPELDEALAYQVQERLIEMKCKEENTKRVGRKLGLTSKAKQEMMGVHEPSYGVFWKVCKCLKGNVFQFHLLSMPKWNRKLPLFLIKK